MLVFGFELEGFYTLDGNKVTLPPLSYPTDGFPGLVELRTNGGHALDECYAEIMRLRLATPNVDFSKPSHVFSREERGAIRRRHSEKTAWDIRNLYGKAPRLLGNKTIASLQISVSNLLSKEYRCKDGVLYPAVYGLFDIPHIVRNLDREFKTEIKLSGRQPGEYAIKMDRRLEYRSLPNSAFPINPDYAPAFLERIRSAVEAN